MMSVEKIWELMSVGDSIGVGEPGDDCCGCFLEGLETVWRNYWRVGEIRDRLTAVR